MHPHVYFRFGALILVLVAVIFFLPSYSSRNFFVRDTNWIHHIVRDVAYGPSPSQKLDLYFPNDVPPPYPVIVAVHGGAFKYGDKADAQLNPVLEAVRRNYAVASINYRLSSEAPFPAAVIDVKGAVRFLRAHAAAYGLDSKRFVAWGDSAGGNLVAMLGTTGNSKAFDDASLGNLDQPSSVQAVIDWFGPIDFLKMDLQFKASGKGKQSHSAPNSPESLYLGGALADVPDKVRQANPVTYLTTDCPPFLIEHGDADNIVPTEQSIDFAKALTAVLGPENVELVILPGAGHADPKFETPENLAKVFQFLEKHDRP